MLKVFLYPECFRLICDEQSRPLALPDGQDVVVHAARGDWAAVQAVVTGEERFQLHVGTGASFSPYEPCALARMECTVAGEDWPVAVRPLALQYRRRRQEIRGRNLRRRIPLRFRRGRRWGCGSRFRFPRTRSPGATPALSSSTSTPCLKTSG